MNYTGNGSIEAENRKIDENDILNQDSQIIRKGRTILLVMLELNSASGVCVINIAEQLAADGYYVHILSYRTDVAAVKVHNQTIVIHGITPKLFLNLSDKANAGRKTLMSKCYAIQVVLTTFMWPWNAPLFTQKLYSEIKRLDKAFDFDCIIPIYSQIDPLLAVYKYRKNVPSKCLISIFLDSLSGGSSPRLLNEERKIARGLKWERKLLDAFDGVVYMKSSKKHHEEYSKDSRYYHKVTFLDIPMLLVGDADKTMVDDIRIDDITSVADEPKKLVYVGTLPIGIRDPRYALNILKMIRKQKTTNNKFRVIFIGPKPSESFIKMCNEITEIEWVGAVPHEEALKNIQEADVLLNFGNNIPGMVPSKIFEYMTYGKPILSFAQDEREPSIPYLEKYPLGLSIIQKNAVEDNVEKVKIFISNEASTSVDTNALSEMFYANTPKCYSEYITKVMAGKM